MAAKRRRLLEKPLRLVPAIRHNAWDKGTRWDELRQEFHALAVRPRDQGALIDDDVDVIEVDVHPDVVRGSRSENGAGRPDDRGFRLGIVGPRDLRLVLSSIH